MQQSAGGTDVVFWQYLEKETVDATYASAGCLGLEGVLMSAKADASETFVKRTTRFDGNGARS